MEWNGPCTVFWWNELGGVEVNLEWDCVVKDSFCVKKVILISKNKEESMEASCTYIFAMEKGWGIFNLFN